MIKKYLYQVRSARFVSDLFIYTAVTEITIQILSDLYTLVSVGEFDAKGFCMMLAIASIKAWFGYVIVLLLGIYLTLNDKN